MTSTVPPPTQAEGAPAQGAPLGRAEGIELLGNVDGSGYEGGAALVRRGDGQMVHLGPLMFALLECIDGKRSIDELTACLSESTGKTFDDEHVVRLAEKLAAQGLLAGTEHAAPPKPNPLLALRWKVLVTNPVLTRRLTAPFTFLFRPWVMAPVLVGFLAVCWFVLIHKGVASATSQAFHKPELLLLIFVLAIASAGFHELGHASACRYGGGTPAGMGMGIYLVWPAFYTDVTDAYRLPRRARLRTDLGGLYFNAIISVATMGVWLAWHVDALLLLVAVQLIEMVKQLSPVIRADGYHILADATGVPDLYAHIGPTLKRLLPWKKHEPSALHGRARALVTIWVLDRRAGAPEPRDRRDPAPAAAAHDGVGQRQRDPRCDPARRAARKGDRPADGAAAARRARAAARRQRADEQEDLRLARGRCPDLERRQAGAPRARGRRRRGRLLRLRVGAVAGRPVPARPSRPTGARSSVSRTSSPRRRRRRAPRPRPPRRPGPPRAGHPPGRLDDPGRRRDQEPSRACS